MEARQLVLVNSEGHVVRTVPVAAKQIHVIRRQDSGRVEFVPDLSELLEKKIKFHDFGIATDFMSIGEAGQLRSNQAELSLVSDQALQHDDNRLFNRTLLVTAIATIFLLAMMQFLPTNEGALEKELRQQVVKIVKDIPRKTEERANQTVQDSTQKVQPKAKAVSLKRLGALAVLGSLNKSKQRGGIDLSKVQTTAGPGMGGAAGSGGVQTSIYAKGMVAAPLGPGANIQGAGGYGTKGKGGGQAGYGTLSLVGGAGQDPVPLTNEATIDGGLDRDLIAAVIAKNLGQIRFCYEQGLQSTPGLAGRVAVDFTIGGNGLVKAAGVDHSSLGSKLVEDCIVMRLKSWKFPLPQGGVDVKVSYPFVLRRAGHG